MQGSSYNSCDVIAANREQMMGIPKNKKLLLKESKTSTITLFNGTYSVDSIIIFKSNLDKSSRYTNATFNLKNGQWVYIKMHET